MSGIRIHNGTPPVSQPRESEGTEGQGKVKAKAGESRAPDEAVKFSPQETAFHRLFTEVGAQAESTQARKVQDFKHHVEEGTYKPNLRVVAERMLAYLTEKKD